MICSTSLCSIPFLGNCDNSRLQMASKQLAQALTHNNCEVPKLIGKNFRILSDSSPKFRLTAPLDGIIRYTNEDIQLFNYIYEGNYLGLEVNEVPSIACSSGLHASKLRYKRDVGEFKKGDVLFEYDCFNNSIPTYGYNLNTAYMSFFG